MIVPNFVWASLALLCLVFVAKGLKALLITHTFGVSRITDDGETLTATASATLFTTRESRHALIQELMSHGDERKEFTDARFKRHIQEQVDKQEKKHIKSV